MRFNVVFSFDIAPKEGLTILYEEMRKAYPDYTLTITCKSCRTLTFQQAIRFRQYNRNAPEAPLHSDVFVIPIMPFSGNKAAVRPHDFRPFALLQ